jgi:putative MFS transporter
MLIAFDVFQTVGFYGFANWVPSLLIQQGINVTSSLLYTTVIGLAAPLGPLLGYMVADRFERKHGHRDNGRRQRGVWPAV